jgi:hypothetical protein
MSNDAELCAGFEVRAYPKRVASNDAAYVAMHKLGSEATGFLTPFEARTLAALLVGAAEKAETK